ncbi:glycosyl transferase family 2, partial [Pseudomonas syringae pv. tagetis]
QLLILSASEYLDIELREVLRSFPENDEDDVVVIFSSLLTRYSFVRQDSDRRQIEAAEKNPISTQPIARLNSNTSRSLNEA